jgi:regulator of cell morphogenesis and NO signaling
MYLHSKLFITPEILIPNIIKENPLIMLVIENFGICDFPKGITISEICNKNKINESLFIQICNLHNGYFLDYSIEYSKEDLPEIIKYLERSHLYYTGEKYPIILSEIKKLHKETRLDILKIIEKYFEEYFKEVHDHMDYEDKIAFPYFKTLINKQHTTSKYSSETYRVHHSDIESKLDALKELFIEHIHFQDPNPLRRKILNDLNELEFELNIHSHIEDMILIPLVKKIEKEDSNG